MCRCEEIRRHLGSYNTMADLLRKYKSLYSSTANSFSTGTGVTITPASVVGLPTDTEIMLTFDRLNGSGVATPSTMERIIGTISAGNFVVRTSPGSGRGADNSTEQTHTSPVVEMIWNAKDWNDLVDGFTTEHNQDGTHKASLTLTTPRVTTGINDSNGNELLKVTATASAVNELTLANAATGTNPVLSATGGDTNTGLDLKTKGTGRFRKPTLVEVPVGSPTGALSTGDAKAFFVVPEELNGMNLTGVKATVYTAGTTGTTDIQIRNKTQTADMLSTKLTIDSTETDSATATPAVINTSEDDVATGDVIAIDIDAVSTTPPQGLVVGLRFELP